MPSTIKPFLNTARDLILRFSESMLPWSYHYAIKEVLSPCCRTWATITAECLGGTSYQLRYEFEDPIVGTTFPMSQIMTIVGGGVTYPLQPSMVILDVVYPGEHKSFVTSPFDISVIGASPGDTLAVFIMTMFTPGNTTALHIVPGTHVGVFDIRSVSDHVNFETC